MGRKIAGAACLLTVALLAGCTGWMEGSFTSVTPHMEAYTATQPADSEAVKSYEELTALLLRLVEEHVTLASVDVSQYPDTLEEDLEKAIAQSKSEDPLTAYAVEDIRAEVAEVGARRVASVTVSYRRTELQVREIQPAWGADGVRAKVRQALEGAESRLVLRFNGYQSLDLNQYVEEYYREHLDVVMECPRVTVTSYPERGTVRILEISFQYTQTQENLLNMRQGVQIILSSAAGYVRDQTSQRVKAQRLFSFLAPLINQEGSTSTPVYSLLCQGTGDSQSVATVYCLLCTQAGLECQVVSGTRDGEPWYWNILLLDGEYCHVDLTADLQTGELIPRFDPEMEAYAWNIKQYPACPVPEPPAPETEEPGETVGQETLPEPTQEETEPEETAPEPETLPEET